MFSRYVGLLSAVALLALSIGIGHHYFGTHKQETLVHDHAVVAGPLQHFPNRPRPIVPSSKQLSDGGPDGISTLHGTNTSVATSMQKNNQILQGLSPVGNPQAYRTDVIGRTFLVSSSVEDNCKTNLHEDCKRLIQGLTQMSHEARDLLWAAETEEQLRNYVVSAGTGKYLIRNLECRMSWCAVEVSSIFGGFSPAIPYDNFLNRKLRIWDDMWGHETDPSAETVTVTLLLVRRL